MKKKILSLCILCVTLFFSCRKENERPSWDTQLLAPLVNASLNINNLLSGSFLHANADSSLKIVYQNDIYGLSMDTLFKIKDTSIITNYPLVSTSLNQGQAIITNTPTTTTYSLPGVQLRKIIVKEGKVKYKITSDVHHLTDFDYSIPSATLNNVPFTIHVTVPAAVGTTPGIYSATFDLAGYTIDLTGPSHNVVNTISTLVSISITNSGGGVQLNNGENVSIDNTFSGLFPAYALGYFGQNTINIGPAVTDFTLFKRITAGSLGLESVNFNFNIENPIGLDARMYVSNLSSINTRTLSSVYLHANSLINVPININRASESDETGIGTDYPTYANFELNVKNSNIKQLIENLPDKLGYSLQIITNPLGNVSGSNDFIYSDKLLKATLNMEIPLSLVATNLTLVDTLSLNISNGSGVQNVHSGTLTLFADNGFPFDAAIQIYLLNNENMVADSIFGNINTIDEAPINANLRATGKKLTKLVIPMSESKMSLLYATKRIVLKVKFNTSAQPAYIRIYSNYSLDVKVAADFNYTVHL